MGSLDHLSLKGFHLLFLEGPIHIASVLVQSIVRPEISLNDSNRLRNAETEFSSANTAVLSSAYCGNLVSSLPMEIPFTFEFCLIETANTSVTRTNI